MCFHRHLPSSQIEKLLVHLPARSLNVLLVLKSASACSDCSSVVKAAAPRDARPADIVMARALGLDVSPEKLEAIRIEAFHLRSLPPEERPSVILRASVRFRSPLLVIVLLARVQRTLHGAPDDALELAEMAAAVATHGARDPGLTALALAYAGNVHRAVGRLDLADPYFEDALVQLRQAPEPPLWLRAELASLHGSLLIDHRFLRDAELQLLNAAAMFKASSDAERVVRVHLKLATLCRLEGDPHAALETIQQALDAFDPWQSPRLHLALLHSLALYLCEIGEPQLARDLMELTEPLYETHPSVAERRQWLLGTIAAALGEIRSAEDHLRATLAGFIERDAAFDAALVAVELADLLLAEGRADEVVKVTRHLPGLFRSLDVHPEAVAATLLFHKAAAEMKVNEEYVAIFRRFLERTRVDRTVRFAPPAE